MVRALLASRDRRGAMQNHRPPSSTLILGIGNELLTDDGAGIHALRRLAQRHSTGCTFVDGGTIGLSLLDVLAEAPQLIVFDAAALDAPAGSVRVIEGAAMDRFVASGPRRSVHEAGLQDLLAAAALGGHLPRRRALVGIQPACVDWGTEPSPAVAAALDAAASQAIALLARWSRRRDRGRRRFTYDTLALTA